MQEPDPSSNVYKHHLTKGSCNNRKGYKGAVMEVNLLKIITKEQENVFVSALGLIDESVQEHERRNIYMLVGKLLNIEFYDHC